MLPSNGKRPERTKNLHMSLNELGILLQHIRQSYDEKWYVLVMLQFSLGLRACEALAIQIWDFKDDYRYLDYRQAKTNDIVTSEPLSGPVHELVKSYLYYNMHRFKDGYLFPPRSGPSQHVKTTAYEAVWAKWRKQIGRKFPRFLDRYDMGYTATGKKKKPLYRIGTHSLRRLHRTVLRNNIQDMYLLKQLCHYRDYKSLERYINTQEMEERREQYLMPILNPVVQQAMLGAQGQTSLQSFRW